MAVMDFDIFAPQISKVAKGIEGKTILVYGDNSTGKTRVATQLPKPLHLSFEAGLNAISGVPFFPIDSWQTFKKLNRKLTDVKTLDKIREMYSTVIFDTVKVASLYCEEYMCARYGVTRLNDANNGFGCWKEFEKEFWKEIDRLTSCGFTVYFIAHPTDREEVDPVTKEKYTKRFPDGDKRTINPICDLVDIIAYLSPNGLDESGRERLSSAYFVNTKEFKARSRFDYMVEFLEEFTAEGLQKAIAEAVRKEEESSGIKAVSYEEQKAMSDVVKKTHPELLGEIKVLFVEISKTHPDQVKGVIEEHLGEGRKISETSDKQIPQLEMILAELQEIQANI